MDSLSDFGDNMDGIEDEQDCCSQQSNGSSNNDSGLSSYMDEDDAKTNLSDLLKESVDINKTENISQTIPRCSTPSESILLHIDHKPATPTKSVKGDNEDEHDLPSPTANLKLLMSAISPEIRDRDKKLAKANREAECKDLPKRGSSRKPVARKKLELNLDGVAEEDFGKTHSGSVSRKDKSLGLLCHRFLSMYPECPNKFERTEISLDQVAKTLSVERRRIYDIMNVLESVELVSRLAKNRYTWHGRTNMKLTLTKLQALAKAEGFEQYLDKQRNQEIVGEGAKSPGSDSTSSDDFLINNLKDDLKKEKSLGVMSQKFLMLFLVAKDQTVSLETAAKILIGDAGLERLADAKYKTKIRRLYDIANILTSLDLIEKVHVTDFRGRKPAFRYTGPTIDAEEQLPNSCSSDGIHRPPSRHSLLHCAKNPNLTRIFNSNGQSDEFGTGKSLLTRHASFESICEAAELERKRLYLGTNATARALLPKLKRTVSDTGSMLIRIPTATESSDSKVYSDATTQSSPGSSESARKPTQVRVVHKRSGVQIVRVRSMPPSVVGSGRSNSPEGCASIKRASPDSVDDPSSECYFDAKRQRKDECPISEPVKPCSDAQVKHTLPAQIVRLKQTPRSSPTGTLPLQLVSPVHLLRTASGEILQATGLSPIIGPDGVPQIFVKSSGTAVNRTSGRPLVRTMSTPISGNTKVSLLQGHTLLSPLAVGHNGLISPGSFGPIKAVRSVAPSNAIINLLPHLDQPRSTAQTGGPSNLVRHSSTDSGLSLKAAVAEPSFTPGSSGDIVPSVNRANHMFEINEILSPNSFFRSTPGTLIPGQSLIPPQGNHQNVLFKPAYRKTTIKPELSATARKLQLCQDIV